MRVVIVDSGCTNVASVAFALERLGVTPEVTFKEAAIRTASHVVLPGVGSAPAFMKRIREHDLEDCLRGLARPCLGICLGMQAMFTASEEGGTETLGILNGRVVRLDGGEGLAILCIINIRPLLKSRTYAPFTPRPTSASPA